MSLSTTEESDRYRAMPWYIEIIVLAQAATILSITVFMYQVYLNDAYFQQYVISLFTSNVIPDAALSIVTASVFALGTFTLLGSMSSSRRVDKEWRHLSEEAKARSMASLPVLEVVEPSAESRRRSRARNRPRRRKPRADVDKLYDSIRYFADDQIEE